MTVAFVISFSCLVATFVCLLVCAHIANKERHRTNEEQAKRMTAETARYAAEAEAVEVVKERTRYYKRLRQLGQDEWLSEQENF